MAARAGSLVFPWCLDKHCDYTDLSNLFEIAQKWAFGRRTCFGKHSFPAHLSKIQPSIRFGLREIACRCVNIAKHGRQRSQRWGASSRRPGCGARSVYRLCKIIQRVMTEEQATADSGFSRYVGHSEGALICIFLLPCLFLCCLSSHNRYLHASFGIPCCSRASLVFWRAWVTA